MALALAGSLAWLWRSDAAFKLKASALATAKLPAMPHTLDYDLVVLAVAIAFFVRHDLSSGFRDYEMSMRAARGSWRCCCGAIAGITGVA